MSLGFEVKILAVEISNQKQTFKQLETAVTI